MLDQVGTGVDGVDGIPPVEGLMERAANVSRVLQEAVEAADGRADNLMKAYQTVLAANEELAADVADRESGRVADQETIARLNAEVQRLGQLCHDTLQHLKGAREERDRVRQDLGEALGASRAENEKLNAAHAALQATHEALIQTNARLSSAFDKLLTDVQGKVHGIRDGGRRLSQIVGPTPHRPRPGRPEAEPARAEGAKPVRLVASQAQPSGAPADDDLLDPAELRAVDHLFEGFGELSDRASA